MTSQFTTFINNENTQTIKHQITQKQNHTPYIYSEKSQVITDYDTFPYPRWFRGVPESTKPIIAEREAGWRPRHDNCYKVLQPKLETPYPNHCFEGPCSVVFPCFPNYLQKFSDREALNIMLNRNCTIQNR